MSRNTRFVTLSICGAALIGFVWLANAGDLNPPVGPIAPTMKTLDEVYDVAASSGGGAECPPCVWEVLCIRLGDYEPWQQIVAGSGVVHSFTMTKTSSVTLALLSDGLISEGGQYLGANAVVGDSLPTSTVSLDVRFENGLYAKAENTTGWLTVLYRSDP